MSNLVRSACRAARAVTDFLLPQACVVCGVSAGNKPVCGQCERELPRTDEAACPVCALPVPGGDVCGRCLKSPPGFDASRAVFAYAFPVDRLVQALKYRHQLGLAVYFSGLIAQAGRPLGVDCVLAMPMHPRALRKRGFNQAVEIARPLAREWGLPLMLEGASRIVDGPPQASLSGRARRSSVCSAFACDGRFRGRSVLVVDDVMTTAASLDALARALKRRGAVRVENLVVARTLAPD